MPDEIIITPRKKIVSIGFALMYIAFAVFIFIKSIFPPAPELLFEDQILNGIFFSGAVDIAIGYFLALVLHARFLGKVPKPITIFEEPRIFLLGLLVSAGYLIAVFFKAPTLGPLFFVLMVVYILKNPVFVLMGKQKEVIFERFSNVYGHALISVFAGIGLFIISILLTSVFKVDGTRAFGFFFLNTVSIYYSIMAVNNFLLFSGKKGIRLFNE